MVSINNLKKSWIVLVVLITLFYAGFLIYSDVDSLGTVFYNINFWYLPLIFFIRFLAIVLRSLRQKLFLKSLGMNIPGKYNLMVYIAGLAMIVTPASSGTLIKSYILNKKFGCAYTKTGPIVIIEKYHDVLAPLTIIGVFLIFIDIFEVRITILILSIVMVVIFFLIRNKILLQKFLQKISKIKVLTRFQENFIEFNESFKILTNKKTMLWGWLIGIAAVFVDGFGIYFGFLALGIDLGYIESFVTVYTANILGVVSFIPGGFIVVEASLLGFLLQSGLVLSAATSAVLITRLSGVWFQIILGFIIKINLLKNISNKNKNN